MADQNITELPVKTSSGMTSSDYMLGIDSAEGYQMLIKDLGDYIIRNVQVNTIAGANQTLKSALDTLNSKTAYAIYNLKDYLIRTDQSTDTIGRIAVFGNVVMVSMQLGGLSLSVGENNIGSLSSFYPSWISSSSGDIFAVGTHGLASTVGNLVRFHLKSNGNISVVASTAQTSTLRVTFTYATSL